MYYEIIYDIDEYDGSQTQVVEKFYGSWTQLQEYIKKLRDGGCYNIEANYVGD